MVRFLLLGLGLLGVLTAPVVAGGKATPGVLAEPAGGFAFTVPKGWTVREFPGVKYKIAHAAPANKFAANLNIVDEQVPGTIQDYVKRNEAGLKQAVADIKFVGQGPFKTNTGLAGVRMVIQNTQESRLVRQILYFLPGKGDRKYVVTFTALADDGTKHDAQVDGSLKTFTLR